MAVVVLAVAANQGLELLEMAGLRAHTKVSDSGGRANASVGCGLQ